MNKSIWIDTYSEFWDIEPTIYSMAGFRLPFALILSELIYLGAGFLFMLLLANIPIINLITKIPGFGDPIFYYLIAPFFIMKLLGKVRLDGKKPYTYFADMASWLIAPKYFEGFGQVRKPAKQMVEFKLPFRRYIILSKFELKRREKEKIIKSAYLIRDSL